MIGGTAIPRFCYNLILQEMVLGYVMRTEAMLAGTRPRSGLRDAACVKHKQCGRVDHVCIQPFEHNPGKAWHIIREPPLHANENPVDDQRVAAAVLNCSHLNHLPSGLHI